ncbi:S8 family serine peptidase [Paludibacterium paludis]|uniref:Peptidase S8/S53 domain-containing protein n=1 Tax=Paludibacterium paludis TaxID=1225769 RepID=A0A918P4S0_9NEIS|nr:S8 family serine peptidase [Paludibacterium paludis]GGY19134.1 hypothetical protein GCM10011289_23240 [Paludibacterium paludis]
MTGKSGFFIVCVTAGHFSPAFSAEPLPNDPAFLRGEQWYLDDPSVGINVREAWGISTGSPSVVIGVLGSGVLGAHPELQGRLLPGYDMLGALAPVPLSGQENMPADPCQLLGRSDCLFMHTGDGDGRDPDASDPGSLLPDLPGVQRVGWQGTGVAGLIGARSDNGAGVSGINWRSGLLPVRVAGMGIAIESDVIDGLRWAAGLPVAGLPVNPHPANVIQLPAGFGIACSPALQAAISETLARSQVRAIIAPAGDDNSDAVQSWPGGCKDVISVAAIGRDGNRAPYSNWGTTVTLGAPGGLARNNPAPGTTIRHFARLSNCSSGAPALTAAQCGEPDSHPGNPYPLDDAEGGLYSSAMATGTVSLMLSVNPALTPSEVKTLLIGSARPFPANSDCRGPKVCGAGLLDAGKAVRLAADKARRGDN